MSLSRRHYVAMAQEIRAEYDQANGRGPAASAVRASLARLTAGLSNTLKADNQRFDRERFRFACLGHECTCGVPSKANYYMHVVYVGSDGETTYSDGYYCLAHKPYPKNVIPTGGKVLSHSARRMR